MVQYIELLLRILQHKDPPYLYGRVPRKVDLLCEQSADASMRGDFDVAISLANQAILLAPDAAEGYEAAANAYVEAKQPDGALKALNYVLLRWPTASVSLALLGFILGENGKLHEAVKYLNLSLIYFPHNPDAIRNLGWYTFQLGRETEGEAILLRALSYAPSAPLDLIHVDLGVIALRQNKTTRALDHLAKARAYAGGDTPQTLQLAAALDGRAIV